MVQQSIEEELKIALIDLMYAIADFSPKQPLSIDLTAATDLETLREKLISTTTIVDQAMKQITKM